MVDPLNEVGKSIEVVKAVLEVAAKNEDSAEAGRSLARSAKTIATTIEVALLPLAAVSFGYKKAKVYFESRFSNDLEAKLQGIPNENIIEPDPIVAAPSLQGLGYSFDEHNLKDMYLSLIAKSMDSRFSKSTHPSFPEIIRQLNPDEAKFLLDVFGSAASVPCAQLGLQDEGNTGSITMVWHLVPLSRNNTAWWSEDVPRYFENFKRLGLIDIDYTNWLAAPTAYDWVKKTSQYMHWDSLKGEKQNVSISQGLIRVTEFGKNFISNVR